MLSDARLREIQEKLLVVRAAHADNEFDVLNPTHHASWSDVKELLAEVARLRAQDAEMAAQLVDLMDRCTSAEQALVACQATRSLK